MTSAPTPQIQLTENERSRLLLSSVTDYAIYMLTPDGYIGSWNTGAERFKGYSKSEILGTHFSRFYTKEDRAGKKPSRALETALAKGRFEDEGWRVRKDGSRFWASVVIDPVFDEKGRHIGFAKITRDITEKREAALELKRVQEALFQSQKLEALGKLTGGVAHDFNNLLAVIMNGLEIITGQLKNPAHAKILESMKSAADRGAKLNHQLLTFARQQPLKQTKNNLNKVISNFEDVLNRANNEAATLELNLSANPDLVYIDSVHFEAALLNLVSNAKDAMPGGGRIFITTKAINLAARQVGELAAGDYVEVTVTDTGSGMSPEVVAKATDPFFTTKPIGKGTGMGLSQVYGFLQQSGGEMKIDSQPGKGTSIFLYLPVVQEDAEETEEGSPVSVDVDAKMCLLVDDQEALVETASELFEILGYDVLTATSGEEALDLLKRNQDIHLLFTDVVMPGINGLTLAKQALDINPDLKVVLTSGYTGVLDKCEEDIKQYHFIEKPYSTIGLLRVLKEVNGSPS